MTEGELTKSAAFAALDITRQLLQVLIAKDLLTAAEATFVIERSYRQVKDAGRANIAQVIELYFGPELKGSWVQRDDLHRKDPSGSA